MPTTRLFLWLGIQRIEEDDMSGPQTRLDGLPSRRLQSHAKAVHSAAGLPAKLVPELDSSRYPDQDPRRCQKQANLLREQTIQPMMDSVTKTIPRLLFVIYFQIHACVDYDYHFTH